MKTNIFLSSTIDAKYPTYIVGGWVRDKIINPDSEPKDLDLCMVAPSFEEMEKEVVRLGGKIFISKPEYFTIRCNIPELGAVDVALARSDGLYSDSRRPDEVSTAKDIEEDLKRRDCTMNAIAIDISTNEIIDPFSGLKDISDGVIKAVGNARERVDEDGLRLLRYFRFGITKYFEFDKEIIDLLKDCSCVYKSLDSVSSERIREEIFKCFKFDTLATLSRLEAYKGIRDYIFYDGDLGLWLKPTFERK